MFWKKKKEQEKEIPLMYKKYNDYEGLYSIINRLKERIAILENPAKYEVGDTVKFEEGSFKVVCVDPCIHYGKATWDYTLFDCKNNKTINIAQSDLKTIQ